MNRKVLMSITASLLLFVLLVTLTSFPTVVLAQSQQATTGSSSSKDNSAAQNLNSAKLLNRLEKIPSLSNIVGVSMVNGIKVSGISVGDTDLSVTLRRQITAANNNTTGNMSS